jgi:hypothetical protein
MSRKEVFGEDLSELLFFLSVNGNKDFLTSKKENIL